MKWFEVPATQYPFWQKRMKVNEIIESLKIKIDSGVSVMEVYNAIVEYSKAKQYGPKHFSWALSPDNVLTVDGSPLKRVGPKTTRCLVKNEAAAYYWENRILARQEAWQD